MDTSSSPDDGDSVRPSKMISRVQDLLVRISKVSPSVRAAMEVYSTGSRFLFNETLITPVLELLTTPQQFTARQVCKKWNSILQLKSSKRLNLTGFAIPTSSLPAITKNQLVSLNLSRTNLNKGQLSWILQKLTHLQYLSLCNLEWSSTVSALTSSSMSSLTYLNLESVLGLNDAAVSQMFRLKDDLKKCSLSSLKYLDLSRTQVSDISLRYIAQNLPNLCQLVLRGCDKITEAGLTQIGDPTLHLSKTLKNLDLTECSNVKDLTPLAACIILETMSVFNSGISTENLNGFLAT